VAWQRRIDMDRSEKLWEFDEAGASYSTQIRPLLQEMLASESILEVADAADYIGAKKLLEFKILIEQGIHHRSPVVSSYSMMAMFDLVGNKVLPQILPLCNRRDLGVKLTALAIAFIVSRQDKYIREIRRLTIRPSADYRDQYLVIHVFDYYSLISKSPMVVKYLHELRRIVPPDSGLAIDLRRMLSRSRRIRELTPRPQPRQKLGRHQQRPARMVEDE